MRPTSESSHVVTENAAHLRLVLPLGGSDGNIIKDSIRFTAFGGWDMEDAVPDHSTMSRFCLELTAKKLYQSIIDESNRQPKK